MSDSWEKKCSLSWQRSAAASLWWPLRCHSLLGLPTLLTHVAQEKTHLAAVWGGNFI